jgi:hypothetical protein
MSIDQIKYRARECGSHFFSKGAMRFFRSRIASRTHSGPGGVYFVTSEQFDERSPRLFTVHKFTDLGDRCEIDTIGKFQQYRTGASAHSAAARAARGH